MKKLFKTMMAIAIAAFTFTACEDVPEPYNNPYDSISGGGGNKEVIPDPAGSGTAADPYNIAKALLVCAEVGEAGTSGEVYAKGYIVEISDMNLQYGNCTYIISDTKGGANRLTVYRGVGLGGNKFTTGDEIKEGDVVVVKGKLVNFKSNTPEFTTGSSIVSINEQGGGDEPAEETIGTKDEPVNVARALTDIDKLDEGATTKEFYYIKGKIKTIKTKAEDISKYKNIDYIITDDGTNELTVFRGKNLGNTDFTAAGEINVGDEVVVYGQLTKYKNPNTGAIVPEVAQGNYIVKLTKGGDTPEPPSGDAKGTGTLEDPFNAVAATNEAKKLADKEVSEQAYYIKGKVAKIAVDKSGNVQNFDYGTYGNASFYISDDGSDSNTFYCYRVLYLGNKKWEEGAGPIVKVGDDVIVYAKLTMYGTTPETSQGNGYLYSLNNVTEGGEEPPVEEPTGMSIDFKAGIGEWTIKDVNKPAEIEAIWTHSTKYGMKATAYESNSKKDYASESWVISPKFSIAGLTSATLKVHQAINFFSSVDVAKTQAVILASTDGTNWRELTLNGWPDKLSWTFFDSTADLSAFAGATSLQIALKYVSTDEKAGTWEVETLTIE